MQISSLLKPEQIKMELAQQKRCNAINEVAQLLQSNPNVTNFAGFYEELLARERIESTCLGNEIAFPHARTDSLKGMVLAIGRSTPGVWFENSGQSVKLIFVIGTPKRMVTDYLSVVGGLARLLKDQSTREKLISAPTVEEFVATLTQAETGDNPCEGSFFDKKSQPGEIIMIVAQLSKKGGPFELHERPIPEPGPGQVLIKVDACGVCHSDSIFMEGNWPGMKFPFVPGHEVAGRVTKVGPGITRFKAGSRVGVGWNGGYCSHCEPCREGEFPYCTTGATTAVAFDGGYAEYMVAPETAVAAMPEGIEATEAAPLLCAGVTTYNALRKAGVNSGDLVAVQGIGGLGHLAVQFAAKSGFHTVAISRGKDKEAFAKELGANEYIDDANGDAAAQLQKMGGATLILATAPSGKAISGLVGGLKYKSKLLIVAAPHDNLEVSALPLIMGSRSIAGHYSGYSKDSEDTLNFSCLTGVRPKVEVFPLEKVNEAYERMISNKARFRVVLKMGN